MKKQLKKHFGYFIVLLIVFCIGLDWPYLLPPKNFGIYTVDKEYKYVISQDETRLCKQVSVLDKNNQLLYHTNGYMNLGWHSGRHELKVFWSPNSYDLFVEDSRGTLDVYVYTGKTWQGPFTLNPTKSSQYEITVPPYDYDRDAFFYKNVPIPYPKENIPKDILESLFCY